jgi:hypothetical protein
MNGAAKKKSLSPGSLAVARVLLLLVVTLFLPQTRVWGFEATPQHAPGKIAFVNGSCTGENYDYTAYDASGSPVAADTGLAVRQGYVSEVEALKDLGNSMRAAGQDAEATATILNAE